MMHKFAGQGWVGGGILMLALCAGYYVLYLAKKQDNPFKLLGYIIGVCVICASGILLLAKLLLSLNFYCRCC